MPDLVQMMRAVSPLNVIRALGRKKRRHERLVRQGEVYCFSDQRYIGVASYVDASEMGIRLRADDPQMLQAVCYVLQPGAGVATSVGIAWRHDGEGGYHVTRSTNLRGFTTDPAMDHVKAFWQSIALDHSLIAPGGAFSRG